MLPFYVVRRRLVLHDHPEVGRRRCDASDRQLPTTSCTKVKDALMMNPVLIDKVRFSVLDFSDDAQIVIPMCDLTRVDQSDIPAMTPRGGTSFEAVFSLASVRRSTQTCGR